VSAYLKDAEASGREDLKTNPSAQGKPNNAGVDEETGSALRVSAERARIFIAKEAIMCYRRKI